MNGIAVIVRSLCLASVCLLIASPAAFTQEKRRQNIAPEKKTEPDTTEAAVPMKVVEVVPGWDEEKPVRFVLESTDGKRGFLDLNLSGTNVFQEVRHLHRFENCLLTEDPRRAYKWPANIWSLIENSKIIPGMTMEQVKLSWGEPEKITRTAAGENWIYQASTLTFKNGTLAGMK